MKQIENYNNINLDSKETELIDVKSKKDEKDEQQSLIKSNISTTSTHNSSFNDSMEKMNSLIVKEKPVTNQYSNIKSKNRRGNTVMYFFDKNGSPKIVIGPHCKKKLYKI